MSGDTYTTTAKYVWEGDSYYDPLVFAYVGGAWRYYLYDGLGSTRQLLDANQSVTDSYTYEAFGNVLSDGGPTANPYRYVGSLGYYQIHPPEAGGANLMHLGARYYVAEVGRFIQRDPMFRVSGRYPYARNRPTRSVDPGGLFSLGYAPAPDPDDRDELPGGPLRSAGDAIWERLGQNTFFQMLNPENWSNANDCKAQCYYDCLKSTAIDAGIGTGIGTGGGYIIGGERGGPIGGLLTVYATATLAMHRCAAQCGYGEALF